MDDAFEYTRFVDFEALAATARAGDLAIQTVIGHTTGADKCLVNAVAIPPQSGSPDGWHIHEGEQIFFVLSGTLTFEVEAGRYEVGPCGMTIAPAGVPHRNWNAGEDVVQLMSFNAPVHDPSRPIAIPVTVG